VQKAAYVAVHKTFFVALMLHRRNQIKEERRRRRRRSFGKMQIHSLQ
jgi:hypothetical protein